MLSIWNKEWRADKEKTGIIEQAQASWQDTIALYRLQEENIIGDAHENPDVYDKLCVVLVGARQRRPTGRMPTYQYAEGAFKESCQKFSLLHVGVVHTLTFLLLQDFSVII